MGRSRSSGSGGRSRLFGRRTTTHTTPAPAPASAGITAPVPVQRQDLTRQQSHAPVQTTSGGGGMMSGLLGTVAQGFMFGSGSAVAHRAVDAVAGPRTVEHVHTGAPGEPVPPASAMPMADIGSPAAAGSMAPTANSTIAANPTSEAPCGFERIQFQRCLMQNDMNVEACRGFMESLATCQQAYRNM